MRDLESLRNRDIISGHFDMYVDDINFSDFQLNSLLEKDVLRLSEINKDDVKDESVFIKLKETSDFLKSVLNKITNEQVKVMFEGVRPFADQILKCIEKDNNCIFKLDNKTFCHEELIETIVVRYLSIKFAKFKSVEEENITDEMRDEYDKLVELHDKMMEIVEKYRVIN